MSKMLQKSLNLVRKMSSEHAHKIVGPTFQQWLYDKAGFNKYGLYRDDILHETPIVQEALRRLPQHIVDERNFRLIRASYIDMRKEVLPKEQWTKLEDDVLYLSPIVEQVKAEIEEKKAWEREG